MEQHIGKYSIIDILGSDAFADVFLAEDPVTKRKVAIKRCSAIGAKRDSLLSECRLLVQLNHSNIITVYDADLVDSHFIIVMEYMAGGSLRDKINKARENEIVLQFESSIKICYQILSALHYAHSQRVIHRDIKPENILFSSEERVKLGDFGVARMLETTQKVAYTKIGTVPYMAPEQIKGRATYQSDIYSVGVVLYEMLTGERAFDGETDYVIMDKIVKADFTPPRKINPNIPIWLEDIVMEAMGNDVQRRYQTAEEMAIALKEGGGVRKKVEVPKVIDLDVDKARNILVGRKLRVNLTYDYVKNEKLDRRIIKQDPTEGKIVDEGMEVTITVGKYITVDEKIEVPPLVGLDIEKAKDIVSRKSLRLRVNSIITKDINLNRKVIKQYPPDGVKVKMGSELAITVGRYIRVKEKKSRVGIWLGILGVIAGIMLIIGILGLTTDMFNPLPHKGDKTTSLEMPTDTKGELKGAPVDHIEFVAFDQAPQFVKKAEPEYPSIGREGGVEGTVGLMVYVGSDGYVKNVLVTQPMEIEEFNQAAVNAAYKCVFTPALKNDKPIGVWISMPVNFKKVEVKKDKEYEESRKYLNYICFKPHTDELLNHSYSLLDKQAKFLIDNPEISVTIEGHDATYGKPEEELKISKTRADKIKELLVNRYGIDPMRIKTIGYGSTRPIADNSTVEGRTLNTRIEFKVN